MSIELDCTDLFCGAGGSGLGAHAAGFKLVMAANHWDRAIETHAANFPDTEHDCADISQVDPRRYKSTAVLWASPECTNHSMAKGLKATQQFDQKPDANGEVLAADAAERSRATMWDVPRFAECMAVRGRPYLAIIVENVVEVTRWVMFPAWLQAMTLLGYEHQIVSLNSMHAQAITAPRAPQSRDRVYIVFHRRGQRVPNVALQPLAWCSFCGRDVTSVQVWKNGRTVGKYRAQYVYHCSGCDNVVEPYALAAATAIDWDLPGMRIGDRVKPLSPKTMARIEAGIRKFSRPMTFEARGNTFVRNGPDGRPVYARAWPVDEPTATLTTSETRALVVPLEGRDGKQARPVEEPMRTMTTRHEDALVVPAGGTWRDGAQSAGEPFSTRTTRETDGVVTFDPFVAELRGMDGSHNRALRSTEGPLASVTAGGNHHMLVRHNSSKGPGGEMCTKASEPARTITTHGHQSLVSIEQVVDDATFRMLEPHEIQAAMAFRSTYRVLGNRREQVRQLGNGVTPPAAEFLLRAVADSLDDRLVSA